LKKLRILVPALIMLVVAVFLTVHAGDTERVAFVMQKIVTNLNDGNYEAIYGLFNETMTSKTTKEQTVGTFRAMVEKLGRVLKTSAPGNVVTIQDVTRADIALEFEHGNVDAQLIVDADDRIAGLGFRPRASAGPSQVTKLNLPFTGTWYTVAGGEAPALNYHVNGHASQRWAMDFVVRDAKGSTYKGEGKKNEDYYAYGCKILAPAAGTVMDVITGIRDNSSPGVPNKVNLFMTMGNAVILKYKDGEYSIMAHLKNNSITVKPGAKVRAGQEIGLCGNSGSITEPQLHFGMMNNYILIDATSIRTAFTKVKVLTGGSASFKVDYSPVKGDTISPD